MTTINRGNKAEPFETALRRASIRVMCGDSNHAGRDLIHLIRLKKIDRIISDAYCVRDGGTIHTAK